MHECLTDQVLEFFSSLFPQHCLSHNSLKENTNAAYWTKTQVKNSLPLSTAVESSSLWLWPESSDSHEIAPIKLEHINKSEKITIKKN